MRARSLRMGIGVVFFGCAAGLVAVSCTASINVSEEESRGSFQTGGGTGVGTTPGTGAPPAPSCPPELTKCGVTDLGQAVCCLAKVDCAADGKSCKSSTQRCGAFTIECGDACCPLTQACSADKKCVSRCQAGQTECATAQGTLGCCPAGKQCKITSDGKAFSYTCVDPPLPSRCKPPQFACTNSSNDPNAPMPQTACCNPGMTCASVGNIAGCCPPGYGPDPAANGKCTPLGPKCGTMTCWAGSVCCPKNGTTRKEDMCATGTDQTACDRPNPLPIIPPADAGVKTDAGVGTGTGTSSGR